jgi:hypothetical protein
MWGDGDDAEQVEAERRAQHWHDVFNAHQAAAASAATTQ